MRHRTVAALALLLALGPAVGAADKPKAKPKVHDLELGKRAPEIEGEDIDGVKFKLSDYRGKVVVLDFWGNW